MNLSERLACSGAGSHVSQMRRDMGHPSVRFCGRSYFASAATGFVLSCFFFQSPIAARIASSASTEQWIFTGGSESSFTMSMFLMARASSTVLPFTHSVASEDEAIAEQQPKVLNFASSMTLV